MTPQRVTLVTLGVADLDRSRRFYEAWGWDAHPSSEDGMILFQMHGALLGLFGLQALAADQGRPDAVLGTGAITLAQNQPTREAVDQVFARAMEAGATVLKAPEEVFWGGYSGYLADPDGHVWEIAMNPFWPLGDDGSLTLPEAAG